jgi:hypothetical protein
MGILMLQHLVKVLNLFSLDAAGQQLEGTESGVKENAFSKLMTRVLIVKVSLYSTIPRISKHLSMIHLRRSELRTRRMHQSVPAGALQ